MKRLGSIFLVFFMCFGLSAVNLSFSGELPSWVLPPEEPENNPTTPDKVALGKSLYFDKRLSVDDTVSCATCHDPAKGFADGLPVAVGVGGKKGTRNSPTVVNAAFYELQFWDGRAETLEEQAKGPIINPVEMGMPCSASTIASSPPRPNTNGSPPLRRTTLPPGRALSTRIALISSCVIVWRSGPLPAAMRSAATGARSTSAGVARRA